MHFPLQGVAFLSVSSPRVDDRGIHLPHASSEPVDVLFGGNRLWSFNPDRDGQHELGGVTIAWPKAIKQRLKGVAQVSVVPHLGGAAFFEGQVRFGESSEPLEFVDDAGNPVTLDKGGRLQRTFDRMAPEARAELIDASKRVLVDLVEECGLDAYLVYGCLLGAVRDGKMIGHDSDADLAWVSKYTHPFDIIRESRAAERKMRSLGWKVVRMSAANFKVWVPLSTGKRAGVDVFGSFHIGDHFHLTGSLRGKLDRDQIMPFGSVLLEGVEFPAPRNLEAFLAYTYGPGWKVPDPAFHFDHPPENTEMMSQWWRGSRGMLWHWSKFYNSPRAAKVPSKASDFAGWVNTRLSTGSRIVELGAGSGRDAVWLAAQGHDVLATDYSGTALDAIKRLAHEHQVTIPTRSLNLESLYSTLTNIARLTHEPGTRHVYARMLVDSLAPEAHATLWRFCSMLGRSGGHTFLEFRTTANEGAPAFFGNHRRFYADPDEIAAGIASYGGTVIDRVVGTGLAPLGKENPEICRMEVSWKS